MFFVTGNYLKSNLSQDKTQNRSSDSNNAVDGSSTPSSQKPVKGVRFKESFLTIPRHHQRHLVMRYMIIIRLRHIVLTTTMIEMTRGWKNQANLV